MTPAERERRREALANHIRDTGVTDGTCIAWGIVYLADTLAPLVDAFVEATKIGGTFGPGRYRETR